MKSDNVPRDIQYSKDTSTNGRHDPLGDVQPPFATDRPGMSRVTVPVVERTKFSSSAAQSSILPSQPSQQQSPIRSPSPIPTEDPDTTNSITAQKRKRSDVDDNYTASQFPDASAMLPPPKQSMVLYDHHLHHILTFLRQKQILSSAKTQRIY